MPSEPRYWGTKQGKIVKAIAVDSIHDWRGLKTATNFTEKELNYNLMLLFKDEVLTKRDGEYYVTTPLEREYRNYYNRNENSISLPSSKKIKRKRSRLTSLSFGIIILLAAVYSYNALLPQTITIDRVSLCADVIDGDTFALHTGSRIRLADIDCPEYYEAGYDQATNALSSQMLDKTVYLDIDDRYRIDVYGRYVCVVYVEFGSSYLNINKWLLNGNYAEISNYDNEFNPNNWNLYEHNVDVSNAYDDRGSDRPSADAASSSSSSSTSAKYVGSRNSNIYHYFSCYWAGQISPQNKVYFTSKADAHSKGYRACKVCKP